MSQVTQTILHDPDNGAIGNCMQAAIASLLDLPLDDVPHFAAIEGDEWWSEFLTWARDLGYEVFVIDGDFPPIPLLLHGKSPRGVSHLVVGIGSTVVWDPHPSRDGLTEIQGGYVLCPPLPFRAEAETSL